MAAQFTPGPWPVKRSGDGKRYIVGDGLVEGPHGYEVAEVYSDDCDPDEAKANAHLIASAPELVDACEDSLKTLTAETIGTIHMDDPDWYLAVDRAVSKLRAALSKARGETPSTLNLEGERG
ncbi:hypothetical protein IC614_02905 [Allosphingosinicella flava]|uniref:Uncharacterized protein n=1 Tax=Allosphingosinicella flava TaxID=2771430 RepID=A0A7T2LMW8_9SPHN|nr:hypothetical protein [Sphingosinicella flava]QPQ55567.1 hypothetical protein IC614_02905 [Sphingosinicella flava]